MIKNGLIFVLTVLAFIGILSLLGIAYWALIYICQFASAYDGQIEWTEAFRRGWNIHLWWIPATLLSLLFKISEVEELIERIKEKADEKFTKVLKSVG